MAIATPAAVPEPATVDTGRFRYGRIVLSAAAVIAGHDTAAFGFAGWLAVAAGLPALAIRRPGPAAPAPAFGTGAA